MPIEQATDLIVTTLEGNADKGGWTLSGGFANNQADATYGRRVDYYLRPEGNGAWMNQYRLALRGSMIPERLGFNRRQSNLPIQISTSNHFLENAGLQGIYFTNTSPSTNPHQIPNLNLGKIVQHIVRDHTNIALPLGWVDISGIDTVNSSSVDVYTIRQSNSIWSVIEQIASNEFYVRYFTKKDELIYEPHPQFRASLPAPSLTIDNSNMVGEPEVIFRNELKTDQVQLYALTDKGVILQKFYPTNIGTEGRRQKFANLRCNSQARLNVLAERAYKFLNREINFRVSLAGPWGAYLELYDRVQVTYSGTTRNGVTVSWTNKKFWINAIQVEKIGNFMATTTLELEEENI